MSRIQLRVYLEPAEVECFLRIMRKDGDYEKLSAIVDTGAQISLLPMYLLDVIDYQVDQTIQIQIDQAGIANQQFEAIETVISLFLETIWKGQNSPHPNPSPNKGRGLNRPFYDATMYLRWIFPYGLLEDVLGAHTHEIEMTTWFTPTSTALIGFGGILERAVFHLDMPKLSGYLEL